MPPLNQQSLKVSGELRNKILKVCEDSGADINQITQALVSALQQLIIMVGPDADTAALNIRRIADDMLASIHKDYDEYWAMAEAQRAPRQ
jgi:DNA-binding LacI/PurR family transcriptional regulator